MKYLIAILSLALQSCSYTICKYCNGAALIIPKQQAVSILDRPDGVVLSTITDDPDHFSYMLTLKRIKKGYAFAEIVNIKSDSMQTGWIELGAIGIRPNNYSQDLALYRTPNTKSEPIAVIHSPYWDYYTIWKCYKDWFYVTYELEGEVYQGWMPPNRQCSDPLSPCN